MLVQSLQAQNKFLSNFKLHYAAATARCDSGCLCHFKFNENLSLNAFCALSLRAEGMGNSNSYFLDCKKTGYMNQNIWRVG